MTRSVKPLLIDIHVEPDESFGRPDKDNRWRGFELGVKFMNGLRAQIEDLTGAPPHFNWQFRADRQIEKTYGSKGWAFDRYAEQIDGLVRVGDDVGLHQHAYRWNEPKQNWTEDYGDQAWMEEVVWEGFEAYKASFGKPPMVYSGGVTWTNNEMIRLVERLGARYDLSAAPRRDKSFPEELGEFTGVIPDTGIMPLHPYQPSLDDFQVPATDRDEGIWIIPLTSGRQSSGSSLRRNFRRFTMTLNRNMHVTKLYLQSPLEYLAPVFDAAEAATKRTHFTLDIRSDAFRTRKNRAAIRRNIEYLNSMDRPVQFSLVRPDELVAHYVSKNSSAADG